MEEKSYFNNNTGVSVTNARFIVHGQTYAMSGVTSVKRFVKKPSIVRMILAVLLMALGGLAAIGVLASGDVSSVIVPVIMLAIGVVLWVINKKQYIVLLNTSSGESQALETKDSALVDSVVEALNTAIIERG
jgi:hypothetical protein